MQPELGKVFGSRDKMITPKDNLSPKRAYISVEDADRLVGNYIYMSVLIVMFVECCGHTHVASDPGRGFLERVANRLTPGGD